MPGGRKGVQYIATGKNLRTGDLEAIPISKQKVNAEIRDTLACLYLI